MRTIWTALGLIIFMVARTPVLGASARVLEDACQSAAVIVVAEVADVIAPSAPSKSTSTRLQLKILEVLSGPEIRSAEVIIPASDLETKDLSLDCCQRVGYRGIFFLIPRYPRTLDSVYWVFARRDRSPLLSVMLNDSARMRKRVENVVSSLDLTDRVFVGGDMNGLSSYSKLEGSDGMGLDRILEGLGGVTDFSWRVYVVCGNEGGTISYPVKRLPGVGRLGVENVLVDKKSVILVVPTYHRL